MRSSLHDESGFTLIELIVVMTVLVLVMAGVSQLFISGLRASNTTNATLSSQVQVHKSLDRLEYEARCSSTAVRGSSGASVTLTIPSWCSHASGTYTWCVSSGSLLRYSGSACSGTGETFASNVTSATPFSCIATVGDYPELQIALSVNSGTSSATAISVTDQIAMRNAALTTSTSAACS